MISAMVRLLPMLLLLSLLPRPAMAQPPIEVSGGFALARDPRDDITLPTGWTGGVAVDLTHALSAVADVSGQYKTVALVGSDAQLNVHTVMGGIRASARLGRLTEFAQVLVGDVRTAGSAFGATTVSHSLGIQPGVGVDFPPASRLSARAQLDLRLIGSQPDAGNRGYQYRFAAGVVYRVNPR